MKKSIVKKLALIQEQYHSIANQLADEGIQSNGKKMVELSKEFSRIEPVVVLFEKYQSLEEEKEAAEEIIKDDDGSMSDLAKEEICRTLSNMSQFRPNIEEFVGLDFLDVGKTSWISTGGCLQEQSNSFSAHF